MDGNKLQIFVSYSHQDKTYLEKGSLIGFLQGLQRDNIEFWTDREIKPGELWDEVIKSHIQSCDIAFVLVSQGFLDSDYCRDVEIKQFLAGTKYVFPVIGSYISGFQAVNACQVGSRPSKNTFAKKVNACLMTGKNWPII